MGDRRSQVCARLCDRRHLCHPGFLRTSTRGILKGRRGVVEESFLNAVKGNVKGKRPREPSLWRGIAVPPNGIQMRVCSARTQPLPRNRLATQRIVQEHSSWQRILVPSLVALVPTKVFGLTQLLLWNCPSPAPATAPSPPPSPSPAPHRIAITQPLAGLCAFLRIVICGSLA